MAHSLAVVIMQASTVLAIGTEQQMRESLTGVRDASKGALDELRSLVTVLRNDAPGTEVAGYLRTIPELLETARRAGVDIAADLPDATTLAGWQQDWPAAVRLAVVRVVQEGLGNVLKHGGSSAQLGIRCGDDAVVVEVRDPGADSVTRERVDGSGHGLIGMRERVAVFGGQL